MKNDMLKSAILSLAAVVTAASILTGCNSQAKAGQLGSSNGLVSGSSTTCTVTSISGGVTVSCSDGTSANIMNGAAGANGTNGTNGAAGATGPAGSLAVVDRNGFWIGTSFVSSSATGGTGNHGIVMAANSYDHGIASYNVADGTMLTQTLYYQAANCAGTAYAPFVPGNTVFANNGNRYKTAVTGAISFAAGSVLTTGMACSNIAQSAVYMFPTAAYAPSTNDLLPISVNVPLSIQ